MAQKCPLGLGIYWNNESEIPEYCLENCESIWRKAAESPAHLDIFDERCLEQCDLIECGDEALQRAGAGAERLFSILNICGVHGTEMFAEEYKFECTEN